jgi:hypothetical protein
MARDDISIEPFRGDLENLERMAHLSWRDEYGAASFPNFYRPDFLRFLFDRIPQREKDHLIAAYRGQEILPPAAFLPLPVLPVFSCGEPYQLDVQSRHFPSQDS